ncbi:uncharacterized protein LOC133500658 [Syngnathoides biaculeatus]|uniref:uncharacterized protein LOC133500658 n=1 Tax=Syngnathoides biaculeatus TaxID=300417 RepID=UPI002ADD8D6E|nr:uncharacterized protein LOC133500658 [Syngnathoides biaculeatus]
MTVSHYFCQTVAPSTTAAVTAAPTVAPTRKATANNGNKCRQGTCSGATCYAGFGDALQTCASTQAHCELRKETVGSATQWTAGCAANCSAQTPCRAATPPPCHLECCEAAPGASCLWLNGTLNHVWSRAAGPTAPSLCLLLALGLLL